MFLRFFMETNSAQTATIATAKPAITATTGKGIVIKASTNSAVIGLFIYRQI
jgi:hypothetical protein